MFGEASSLTLTLSRRRERGFSAASNTEVNLLDPLVGEHRVGLALADDRAEVQHSEPRREPLQRMNDMLDPDDRRAALVDLGEDGQQCVAFAVGQAAGDLVEQQQRGLLAIALASSSRLRSSSDSSPANLAA